MIMSTVLSTALQLAAGAVKVALRTVADHFSHSTTSAPSSPPQLRLVKAPPDPPPTARSGRRPVWLVKDQVR